MPTWLEFFWAPAGSSCQPAAPLPGPPTPLGPASTFFPDSTSSGPSDTPGVFKKTLAGWFLGQWEFEVSELLNLKPQNALMIQPIPHLPTIQFLPGSLGKIGRNLGCPWLVFFLADFCSSFLRPVRVWTGEPHWAFPPSCPGCFAAA